MTARQTDGRRWDAEEGAIPFVLVGIVALGGVLGAAWVGHEWSQRLLGEAGGELTVWVLRGAFWALDLVALQASTSPVNTDWYTPVLTGPALPIYALAALVVVGTLLAEVITGIAQGNTTRIVQAVFRALLAGMLASIAATVLLTVGGALSEVGRAALAASGTSVDAPLIPLQEVLMEAAEDRDGAGVELFIAFLAAVVIVFTSVSIYFILAMRPVVLAAIIVFLPIAHALSVWEPMRRVQLRVWSLAVAVLLAEAAILTMFAVTNTAVDQPQGVDRLIFGTFGLLLAALAPAALARIVGAPELHSAVSTMSRGSKALAIGGGLLAVKGARAAVGGAGRGGSAASGRIGGSALETTGPGGGGGPAGGGAGPGGGPSGSPSPAGGVGAAGGAGSAARPATAGTAGSGGGAVNGQPGTTSASGSAPSAGAASASDPAGAATATTAAAAAASTGAAAGGSMGAASGGSTGAASGGSTGAATGAAMGAAAGASAAAGTATAAAAGVGASDAAASAAGNAPGAAAGAGQLARHAAAAAPGRPAAGAAASNGDGVRVDGGPVGGQPAVSGGSGVVPRGAAGGGSGSSAAGVGWSSALQAPRGEVAGG